MLPLSESQEDRDRLASRVRMVSHNRWPDEGTKFGRCLADAMAGLCVLKRKGYQVVLQAGSLSWPCIDPTEDDGVCVTHFSFMWEPYSPATTLNLLAGQLPEMHVWLGLVDRQEIVDFSIEKLPTMAEAIAGINWTGPKPPRYLWCSTSSLPDGVVYHAEEQATRLAMDFGMKVCRQKTLCGKGG